jgi:hypothetical protein
MILNLVPFTINARFITTTTVSINLKATDKQIIHAQIKFKNILVTLKHHVYGHRLKTKQPIMYSHKNNMKCIVQENNKHDFF